jgi:nitrous oxidase accessory protein NosD
MMRRLVFGLIILLFVIGVVHTIKTTVKADPTDGLVGHWCFNEENGTILYDNSGNGYDGTIDGATWTTGISGGALSFDGINDYVQFSSPVLNNPPYSVCAWVKPLSLPGYTTAYIVSNGGQTRVSYGFYLSIEYENNWQFGAAVDGGDQLHLANSPSSTGEWCFLVGTWDGSPVPNHLKLYVNGAPIGTYGNYPWYTGSANNLRIGAPSNGLQAFYHGVLDEVRVYNRVLTEDEIHELYNRSTVYVDDDFTSSTPGWGYDHFNRIQDGVNAVSVNGTVFVFNGDYCENILINRSHIMLQGEDKNSTIIDASGSVNGLVTQNTDHITISGFTIRNASENGILLYGLSSDHSWINHDFNLNNLIIRNNSANGIYLHATGYGCRISNTQINNCEIFSNGNSGISIHADGNHCIIGESPSHTNIANCQIRNNSIGVSLRAENHHSYVSAVIIQNCSIEKNNDYGIETSMFGDCWNDGNIIYLNNFVNNTVNAYDPYANIWQNDELHQGNYWSDYSGSDNNFDGIGDTPYNLPGGSNQDVYPLMTPYGLPHANITFIINDKSVIFNASFSYDYNGIITEYQWQFGDGNNGTGVLVNHPYSDYGTYAVSLTVVDNEGSSNTTIQYISLEDLIPPIISDITLITSEPLDTDPSFGWINITWDVTDNLNVSDVHLNITCPDGSTMNISMNTPEEQKYSYNTTFTQHGDYHYFIWASDPYGNMCTSSNYEFIMPPNWDINVDGEDNLLDFILISNHYAETGSSGWLREDVSNDGSISILDLVLVSNHYDQQWLQEKNSTSNCFGNTLDDAIIRINPQNQTVTCGENFTVSVYFASGQPIKGWESRLSFNASLITVNAVTEGDFFDGFTTFFNPGIFNNTNGNIVTLYDFIVGSGNVSDPGTFITISFTAGSIAGTSYLNLYNVGVCNETSYVPITVCNGYVEIAQNTPPYTPSDPNPTDGATGIDTTVILSWKGGDPDPEDIVTYDVYFGTSSSPLKVASNITVTTYTPGTLTFNTTYYWRIIGWDNHGAYSIGPLWHFTTQVNTPPGVPFIDGPSSGKAKKSYNYTFVAADPENDDVFYQINWGDGQVTDWIGPYESNVVIIRNHTWQEKGTYTIAARAKDIHGAIGEWGTLTITMPMDDLQPSWQSQEISLPQVIKNSLLIVDFNDINL